MLFCFEAPRTARACLLTAVLLFGALAANAQSVPDLSVPQVAPEESDSAAEPAA